MHTAPDQIKSSSFSFQSFSSERSFPICNPKQGGFERVPRPFCQIVWHTCSEKTWLLYCHCPIKLDHSPASKCNIYLCWQILIRIPKHFFVVFRWVCLVSELSAPTPQCLSAAKRWLCAAAGMRCGNARAADRGWTSQLRHRPPSELKLPDVCWPAELKLVELAQRLAAAPLALNQHMPCHHENQHLEQKHWFQTVFGSQDY